MHASGLKTFLHRPIQSELFNLMNRTSVSFTKVKLDRGQSPNIFSEITEIHKNGA